jgi:hypothetical protein
VAHTVLVRRPRRGASLAEHYYSIEHRHPNWGTNYKFAPNEGREQTFTKEKIRIPGTKQKEESEKICGRMYRKTLLKIE